MQVVSSAMTSGTYNKKCCVCFFSTLVCIFIKDSINCFPSLLPKSTFTSFRHLLHRCKYKGYGNHLEKSTELLVKMKSWALNNVVEARRKRLLALLPMGPERVPDHK